MHAPLPAIHLVVMQPTGYVHSLGLLDPARYLRHMLRRLGATVTLAKNRLREDALNLVFGAHLGFPVELLARHACLFVNLEQLGPGGAAVTPDYLALLRAAPVADYDADNLAAYGGTPDTVPVLPFLHAPYLQRADALPLDERPFDLLFFGSMNPRRQRLIERIEACGRSVAVFDAPLYGPERDDYIVQARAVLNCHFYDSSRFEQVRVAHCLSLGTPVVSERRERTRPGAAFEEAVDWFDEASLEAFFTGVYPRPDWASRARDRLAGFAAADPLPAYRALLARAVDVEAAHRRRRDPAPDRPTRLHLGSGKDYKPGWLNLDVIERAEPDLVLDLGRPVALPLEAATRWGGRVLLAPGQFQRIYANNVLEHVPDLPMLMGNALALLAEGGEIEIEVPYEKAPTAWQDPTHVRAMNENSWIYYTDWFWYLGWFTHRFEAAESTWLDARLQPCPHEQAAFMRVRLRKVATSPRERTLARTMQADFGGLADDPLPDPAEAPAPPTAAPWPPAALAALRAA